MIRGIFHNNDDIHRGKPERTLEHLPHRLLKKNPRCNNLSSMYTETKTTPQVYSDNGRLYHTSSSLPFRAGHHPLVLVNQSMVSQKDFSIRMDEIFPSTTTRRVSTPEFSQPNLWQSRFFLKGKPYLLPSFFVTPSYYTACILLLLLFPFSENIHAFSDPKPVVLSYSHVPRAKERHPN